MLQHNSSASAELTHSRAHCVFEQCKHSPVSDSQPPVLDGCHSIDHYNTVEGGEGREGGREGRDRGTGGREGWDEMKVIDPTSEIIIYCTSRFTICHLLRFLESRRDWWEGRFAAHAESTELRVHGRDLYHLQVCHCHGNTGDKAAAEEVP